MKDESRATPPPAFDEAAVLAGLRGTPAARRAALATLYDALGTRLRAYFQAHGAGRADAEDLAQEAFMRVITRIDTFRGEAPLVAWIWTIARNALIDSGRRVRPVTDVEDEVIAQIADPDLAAVEHLEGEELVDCVRKRFAEFRKVDPDRAQCIVWAANDGMSMADIAGILARTVGATREYVSQCRKKLKAYLEPCLALLA